MKKNNGAFVAYNAFLTNGANLKGPSAEEMEILELNDAIDGIICTTGFDFSTHEITRYYGVCSGHSCIGTGIITELGSSITDLLGTYSLQFARKMENSQKLALHRLKESVFNLCKAENETITELGIIGVQYNYFTLGVNMISVAANGTAVRVKEK